MGSVPMWRRYLRFVRADPDADVEEEMRFHLESRAEELVEAGVPEEEARARALREYGDPAEFRAQLLAIARRVERRRRRAGWWDSTLQDLRYAIRMLRRSPGFAVAVVLTLALGIGVNAGVFSLIDGILFRARVPRDAGSFVHLAPQHTDSLGRLDEGGLVTAGDFAAYREVGGLEDVSAWAAVHLTLGRAAPREMLGMVVSCAFFRLYGLQRPLMGRVFTADECGAPGGEPVVVISEALWRDELGADPGVVGRSVEVEGRPFTVVGVLPARFAGRLRGPGVWLPYPMRAAFFGGADPARSEARWLYVEGRLAPGASRDGVRSALQVAAANRDRSVPGRRTRVRLTDGSLIQEPALRATAVWVVPLVMGAVSLVLVLVCANVLLLLLARAVRRRPEMALRTALGAGRGRLVRLLVVEGLVLAALAGSAGAWLASVVPRAVERWTFTADSPFYPGAPRSAIFAYLLGVCLLVGVVAGVAPAAESLRTDLSRRLARGGRAGRSSRDALIGVQVAVSTLLLTGAAWFVATQSSLDRMEPGFEADHLLAVQAVHPAGPAGPGGDRLARRLRDGPAVRSVAVADALPIADEGSPERLVGRPGDGVEARRPVAVDAVSPGFFGTTGIPIVRGRAFRDRTSGAPDRASDRAPDEAVVSEALARRLWPGGDALEQRLVVDDGVEYRVVGIARDTRPLGGRDGSALLYTRRSTGAPGGVLLVRFEGDASRVSRSVVEALREIDPDAVVLPRTAGSLLAERAARFWRVVRLVLVLAALAVVLAAIGVYGVVSFAVAERTREIGIRRALGATRARIAARVLRVTAPPVLAGICAGQAMAFLAGRALERVFRDAPVPFDAGAVLPYAVGAVAMALVAVVATSVPVRRATSASPVESMLHP